MTHRGDICTDKSLIPEARVPRLLGWVLAAGSLFVGCSQPQTAERTSPRSTVTQDSILIAVFDPDPCTFPDDSRRYRDITIELDGTVVLSETLDFVLTRRTPDSYKREISRTLPVGTHTILVRDESFGLEATLTFDHLQERSWILIGYRNVLEGRTGEIFLEVKDRPPTER